MSEPITTALRGLLCARPLGDPCWDAMDAVDAVHAALEAENAALRERVEELDNVGGSMHDGESITDELREYAEAYEGSATHASLDLIAERIDAEHESACAEAYGNGVMSVPIALDESQWVKLPVDADGEVIHIGDEMEYGRAHGRVIALMLSNYPKKWGGGLHWGIQLEGEQAPTALNLMFHHYHAPTVEDVLTKFGIDWEHESDCEDRAALLREYASKLRLAGDAE